MGITFINSYKVYTQYHLTLQIVQPMLTVKQTKKNGKCNLNKCDDSLYMLCLYLLTIIVFYLTF